MKYYPTCKLCPMCCVVADKPYSESKTVIVMFPPNGSLSAVLSIAKAMN